MKQKEISPVRLLLRWAGPEKKWLIGSVLCAFGSGLLAITAYLGLYRLMDAVLSGACTPAVIADCAVFVMAGTVGRMVLLGASGVLSHKGPTAPCSGCGAWSRSIWRRCPWARWTSGARERSRPCSTRTIEKLELFLAHNLPEFVAYLTGPVVIFLYLLSVNVPLALVSLLPLPLAGIVMGVIFGRMKGILEDANRSLVSFNSVMIEYVSGMRLIKAYNMGSRSFQKFSHAISEENRIWNLVTHKTAPPYAAFLLLVECGMLLMIPAGGLMFLRGSVSASVFLLFAYVGGMYLTEILPLQKMSTTFAQALSGVGKVREILELPVFEGGGPFPEDHGIELDHVTFSYDGKTDVLRDCSLSVKQGEKVALVGVSGAGKSTIIQLISRFYDTTKGEVRIGGRNVRDIRYEDLLAHISIVFQKTFLTRDSVLENIRMGTQATLEQVREAARLAQIDDFILSLPQGYDTKVGAMGSRFSGGERQRIAIARAILKDAPILILDEATSAADPENQVEIDRAIENLCRGKTVLIVAHRLGAVKMCDKVAVVEDHTITCCGTHAEVLEQNSYYRKAWADYRAARSITYSVKGGQDDDK